MQPAAPRRPQRKRISHRILLVAGAAGLAMGGLGVALGLVMPATHSGKADKALPLSDPVLALGARLYAANCQACHGDRQGSGRLSPAPPHNEDGHTWHHSDRNLIETIMNGSGEMGEMMRRMMGVPEDAPRMPAFRDKLSEEDVHAILGYIKTWWTPQQRRMQEQSPMMR